MSIPESSNDALSYTDFIKKYGDVLEKGELSEEIKDQMIAMVYYHKEDDEYKYKRAIDDIYTALVFAKYGNSCCGNKIICIDAINTIIENCSYLSHDKEFRDYDVEKLCNEVYEQNHKEGFYSKFPKEMDEELKSEHITDMQYYLGKLSEYAKTYPDSEYNRTFIRTLDFDIRRLI